MMLGQTLIANKPFGVSGETCIRVKIGFSFNSEVSQIRRVLYELAINEPGICTDPEPYVRFRNIGNHSMDFELICWAESPRYRNDVAAALNQSVYKLFMSAGCRHQVVYTMLS